MKETVHKISNKPCLYSHFGLCNPCPNIINKCPTSEGKKELRQKYLENIKMIKRILDRKILSLNKILTHKIQILSLKEDFEEAAKVYEKLKRLEYITEPKYDYK